MMKLPAAYDVLKQLTQWVGYKAIVDDKGKVKKIPINPHNGQWAKANDSTTWGTFAEAEAAVARYKLSGLGIEFGSGIMGVDLDHCINDDGSLTQFADTVVTALDSYTEFSPSGTGLHILLKTTAPEGTFCGRDDKLRLEMYDTGRFFTITGKVFGDEKPICDDMETVQTFYDEYLKKPEKHEKPVTTTVVTYSTESTSELWEKAFASANGDKIRDLYNGNWNAYPEYPTQSNADLGLADCLAYWTNGDAVKMDEMFRQTGLMRQKWDKMDGAQTYGARTIAKALANFQPFIKSGKPAAQPEAQLPAKDPNPVEQIPETSSVNESAAPIQPEADPEPVNESVEPIQQETVKAAATSTKKKHDNVHDYFLNGLFDDFAKFRGIKERKTGFANIDKVIGCLYPGLYMLGAMPGAGKTTFMHQMADQLAAAGEHVLYFSLEQTQLELFSKGLSRTTAQRHFTDWDIATEKFRGAIGALDIRRGKGMADSNHPNNGEFYETAAIYVETIKTESIIQCNFETTIETIIEYVERYIAEKGVKPVVIVDYLQIIRPIETNGTTRDAVDGVTRALKLMQSRNDLVVVAICALNRGGYITPLDFESFRETSGIEYTADVVWGLQLQAIHEDLFNKQNQVQSKRDRVTEEMGKTPRKIEFVSLKNRYGRSRYACNFDYYSGYDLFVPADSDPGNNLIDITPAAGKLPFDDD